MEPSSPCPLQNHLNVEPHQEGLQRSLESFFYRVRYDLSGFLLYNLSKKNLEKTIAGSYGKTLASLYTLRMLLFYIGSHTDLKYRAHTRHSPYLSTFFPKIQAGRVKCQKDNALG